MIHTVDFATTAETASSTQADSEVSVTYAFDRRREDRAQPGGWAQVLCRNPYRTFLGGSLEIADISGNGIGLVSDHPIPLNEVVEVRLAPFKVRGRLGRVVGVSEKPAASPPIRLSSECVESDEAMTSTSAAPRFRIGIVFSLARAAA